MKYERMPIEIESPEEYGYDKIKYNLSESSITDQTIESLNLQIPNLTLLYNEHRGETDLRKLIADDAKVSTDEVLITSGAAAVHHHHVPAGHYSWRGAQPPRCYPPQLRNQPRDAQGRWLRHFVHRCHF